MHGWASHDRSPPRVLESLSDDTIGLAGEVGEIANLVKKLRREAERTPDSLAEHLEEVHGSISEEVVDSLIYLLRIADHLEIDLDKELERKTARNLKRFRRFEV